MGLRAEPGCVVLLLLLGIAAKGCIVPAPIFEEDRENHAVWVDFDQVYPDPMEDVHIDRWEGGVQDFHLGRLLDDDLEDSLYLRWFINYDDNSAIRTQHRLEPQGKRARQVSWTLDICGPRSPAPDLREKARQEASLMVVISDRQFLSRPDQELVNRSVPDKARPVTVFWRLKMELECRVPQ